MAKFRSSQFADATMVAEVMSEGKSAIVQVGRDRPIGKLLQDFASLSADQVNTILAHQQANGLRFGEAAIALGMVSPNDVLYALSQQFQYPYAPEGTQQLHPELVTMNQPFSDTSEAIRAIRSQVMTKLYAPGEPRRALAIISPNSGDGKTFFCANLGVALAQLGGRTLIVDADLRGPRLHEVLGADNSAGFSSLLAGRAELQVIQQVPGVASLFVLPVGVTPPNPFDLIERPAFGILLREMVSKFDHVLVDTPAATYGSDAAVIAARCGAALVVARKDSSHVGALRALVSTVEQSTARLAGVVMNEY